MKTAHPLSYKQSYNLDLFMLKLKIKKVTNQHDDRDTTHGIPSGERLKVGIVGEFGSINTLCFHTLIEAKVSDSDSEPS
jgi:hypothetical protein